MAVELLVADEFARWFEWLAAADEEVAREVVGGVEAYASATSHSDEPKFDVCISCSGRLAFVAANVDGVVFLAAGAEIDGSGRRAMTLVSRARKITRRMRQGRLELVPWKPGRVEKGQAPPASR
jgi:hypothetical protein